MKARTNARQAAGNGAPGDEQLSGRGKVAADPAALEFTLPLRTAPGQNAREHWAVRAKRVKRERQSVRLLWPGRGRKWAFPMLVTLTRISPGTRPLDSHDNLAGALKAIVDQVAAELGVDDGDRERIRFAYEQERGPWGVRVRIEAAR